MLNFEKQYSIALRKKKHNYDFFWKNHNYVFNELKINCKNRYWLADPFLYENDGILYIFFEAYDLITKKGKIAYVTYFDGKCSEIKIILKEKYHLSFPFIFKYYNNVYIMPESCGDKSIKLFKAVNFPNSWVESKMIINDIFACDSILLFINNKKYLLTSEMYDEPYHGKYQSCWVKNMLYFLDDKFNIVNKNSIMISEGDDGVRNAGGFVIDNDVIYRVGQDCRNNEYGRGIVIFKLDINNNFCETEFLRFDFRNIVNNIKLLCNRDLIGFHTYNQSENYEIIDFSYMKQLTIITFLFRVFYKITIKFYSFFKINI